MTQNTTYATANEIEFLRGLGKHSIVTALLTRRQLLERYRRAMGSRTHWGQIDPHIVSTAIQEMLEEEAVAA